MSDRYFLDTNVFVYCFDRTDHRKQQIAEKWVGRALKDRLGVISSQVIQEFFNVATRKFTPPMSAPECRAYLETVLSPLCEIFPSLPLYQDALSLKDETGYSFYDALVVAAAREANCRILFSEDLHEGQIIGGLKIQNPFRKTD